VQPHEQRGRRPEHEDEHEDLHRDGEVGQTLDTQRVAAEAEPLDRSRRVGRGDAARDDRRRDEPGEGAPTGRRQPAVREQQPQEREQADVRNPQPGGDPCRRLAARLRSRPRQERVGGVLAAEQEHRADEAYRAEKPSDGIAGGEAGGDHGADRREAHRHHGVLGPLLEDEAAEVLPAQHQQQQPERREH